MFVRKQLKEENQEGVVVEGGLPGGDPVSLCPSAWLWGPLPLVQAAGHRVQSLGSRTLGAESRQLPLIQAAGRWVRSQAHSRVKALPSGPLRLWPGCVARAVSSAPGFCSQLVASVLNSLVWFRIVSLPYGPK